jgi:hypothetical protein
VDVNARRGFERHVGGGLGLGKSEGRGERRRVPLKHKLAHLLIDELGNELLDQGKVVVNLFAGICAVVDVSEAGMLSSDVLQGDLLGDVVLCAGVDASSRRHELLLVPCDQVLPGGDLDRRVGGQVGNVDRDDVGRMSGRLLGHCRTGLPDPTDIGPRISLTNLEIMRFPRHPFYSIR